MEIGAIIILVIFIVVTFLKTARVVPQKSAFIVERLGKYKETIEAGFHILIPFVDRIAYKHSLKEIVMDVPPQSCITKDNIAVLSHDLYDQFLPAEITQFVQMLNLKVNDPFQSRLINVDDSATTDMLSQ